MKTTLWGLTFGVGWIVGIVIWNFAFGWEDTDLKTAVACIGGVCSVCVGFAVDHWLEDR